MEPKLPLGEDFIVLTQLGQNLAGAICFSTGDGLRNGDLTVKSVFKTYCQLNPDFPTGIYALLMMGALKLAASAWAKEQRKQIINEKESSPAIIEFEDIPEATHTKRANIVNEIVIEEANLDKLKIKKIWCEDKYIQEVKDKVSSNVEVVSISLLCPPEKKMKKILIDR